LLEESLSKGSSSVEIRLFGDHMRAKFNIGKFKVSFARANG
jgi:hypothetical protein